MLTHWSYVFLALTHQFIPGDSLVSWMKIASTVFPTLQWRHNGNDDVSNHQPHHCLLNCLFRRRSKKTSKLCVTGLCTGNSPVTGEFLTQMACNPENVYVWWRHHVNGYSFIELCFYRSHWPQILFGSNDGLSPHIITNTHHLNVHHQRNDLKKHFDDCKFLLPSENTFWKHLWISSAVDCFIYRVYLYDAIIEWKCFPYYSVLALWNRNTNSCKTRRSRRHTDIWSHPGHYPVDPYIGQQKSRSWSRMIDPRRFCSMSIGPPIPEIWLFQNFILKIEGQGHGQGLNPMVTTFEAQRLIDMFAFHFMAMIGPFLAEIQQILYLTIKFKVMARVKSDGLIEA